MIGCGVIGLTAIGTCVGLGATVRAFDARRKGREEAASLGAEPSITEELASYEGGGIGGYAKEMGEEYYL